MLWYALGVVSKKQRKTSAMENSFTLEAMNDLQQYLQRCLQHFSAAPPSFPFPKTMERIYQPIRCTLYKRDFHDPRSSEHAFLFSSLPDVMEHDTAILFDAFSLSFWSDGTEHAYMKTMPCYKYYANEPLIWEQVHEEKNALCSWANMGSAKALS